MGGGQFTFREHRGKKAVRGSRRGAKNDSPWFTRVELEDSTDECLGRRAATFTYAELEI